MFACRRIAIALLALHGASSLCIRTIEKPSPEFFKSVFRDYANYTAADYEHEINCLKLELFESDIKTRLLERFNPHLTSKNLSMCERVLSDFRAWKSEKFCRGIKINESVFLRYLIVLLEKPPRAIQKVEGEAFAANLDEIVRALLHCFIDDGLIELTD